MRLVLAIATLLAAFGCTTVEPSREAAGAAMRSPSPEVVDQDAMAILSGMARARANQARAGL